MRPILTTQDLQAYAGDFVAFEIAGADYDNANCFLINGKKIARVSRATYQYKEEAAYKFAILRKNRKFNYCYLNNTILKEINLTINEISADENDLIENELKDTPSKFAGGECFLDGCKPEALPDTENVSSMQAPILLANKTSFFDKLDDNLMLFAVFLHLAHKMISWLQKKPSQKVILQDKAFFDERKDEVLNHLNDVQKKLNDFPEKQEYSTLQWAHDGLKNYKDDIKQLPMKYDRGLAPQKFAKIMGNIEYFLYKVTKEISPDKPKEKEVEIPISPKKPTWRSWLLWR